MSRIETVRTLLGELWSFLQPQLDLANAHMVDFFTKSAYKKLTPNEIQSEVEIVGCDEFIDLLFGCDSDQLLKIPKTRHFINMCNKFTLKNLPVEVCLDVDSFFEKLNEWGCTEIDKFKLEIFMTPKKSHEVEILSAVSSSVSKISNVSHLVDIGDGKGYLSSMLALRHQIPVLGVDSCNTNTEGAIKRVQKLSKVWNGVTERPLRSHPSRNDVAGKTSEHLYRQITKYVNETDDFLSLIKEHFPDDDVANVGLVGLHTCGDLAQSSLKIYQNCEYIKSICNVGCCYHLLTEGESGGFPLSNFLTDLNVEIGRSGRMIANQSVDRILTSKELPNRSIYYRALLQVVLEKECPVLPTDHVGRFRKPCANFIDYAWKAFDRLNIEHSVKDDDLEKLDLEYRKYVNELNVFYLIRCQLSPVIESLILLDRLCFLLENDFESSFIVQLFNPVISPRCYGILSMKDI